MKRKVAVWVGSFAVIFLFLPSLAVKIGLFFVEAPWHAKSWFFYLLTGLLLIFFLRWRRKKNVSLREKNEQFSLLFLAKERLAKGEISLEEFREIRRELD